MSQTYRTRVLTARDHLLVDKLSKFPRYAPLVARITGGVAKPVPKIKPAKAAEPDTDTTTPDEPAKPAHEPPTRSGGDAPSKPSSSGR